VGDRHARSIYKEPSLVEFEWSFAREERSESVFRITGVDPDDARGGI